MHLLWFSLIGIAAGWPAGRIMGAVAFGIVGDLVIGMIGPFVGTAFHAIRESPGVRTIGTLITATLDDVVPSAPNPSIQKSVKPEPRRYN
jgi:uncharacterized membrane protein YeaQ/YmgE (transglycosylase-associated protein family)